jgi:hypothetical protein
MTNSTCTLQLNIKKQKTPKEKINSVIIESIDRSFSSFKNLDKEAAYRHLELDFKIKKEEIPLKIEGFADAIEQMFGIASKLVEIRIIEALHKRFPEFVFFPKKDDVDFKEYVVALRALLLHTFIS